jgi:hypothetical protein
MGVDSLSHGELVPSIKVIRRRMGKVGPRRTSVTDFARAVPTFRVEGHNPLQYRIVQTVDEVEAAVRTGRFVHICISYGTFNVEAGKTGDPNFNGGHSVGVKGERSRDGVVWYRLFDPLDDHRRPELSPKGPRWVKRSALVRSMEAFAGSPGSAWAGVFMGGTPI